MVVEASLFLLLEYIFETAGTLSKHRLELDCALLSGRLAALIQVLLVLRTCLPA